MTGDLDLALRIKADVAEAAKDLKRLQSEVAAAGKAVAKANAAEATSAATAARAARKLNEVRVRAKKKNTEAARETLRLAEAQDRAAREALKVARAETRAATASQRAARAAEVSATAYTRNARAASAAAVAQTRLGGTMSRSRVAIQNTAFQVQDFAVQVAAGTAASRAAAQQLPQLLGGFGVLGAVMGAVAAVALPLASHLLFAADAAEEAGEATDALGEATDRLTGLRDLRDNLNALSQTYGEVTAGVLALVAAQARLATQAQTEAASRLVEGILGADILADAGRVASARTRRDEDADLQRLARLVRESLGDSLGDLDNPITSIRQTVFGQLRAALEDEAEAISALAEEFGASVEETLEEIARLAQDTEFRQIETALTRPVAHLTDSLGLAEAGAERLVAAIAGLRDAGNAEDQAEAMARLRNVLEEALRTSEALTDEQIESLTELYEGTVAAEDALRKAAAASGDLESGIEGAAGAALRLSDRLREVGAEIATIRARAEDDQDLASLRLRFHDDPVELARQRSLLESNREIAPIEQGYIARGLTPDEARARTAHLREDAAAAAEAVANTAKLEVRIRALSHADRDAGRGRDGLVERLRRQTEEYARAAEDAGIRLQGLSDVEEARALAAAEAGRLAAEAIAAVGAGPGAAERIAEIRDLEAALIDAATRAAELNEALERGPQGFAAARRALRDYAVDAINAGNRIYDGVGDAFEGLEDVITNWVTKGRAEISDFVDAIIADFARITIRRSITGPLASAFGEILDSWFVAHDGRVVPGQGEVPALLMAGEAVLTSGQSRALLGQGSADDLSRAIAILAGSARFHTGGVAGGASGAPVALGPAGPQNIRIQIENRGGTPVRATEGRASVSGRDFVIGVVMEDAATNGPFTQTLSARLRGGVT